MDNKKYYAPGIPLENFNNKRISVMPEHLTGAKMLLSIQKHDALRAGTHYDLRLGDSETGFAYSWAIPAAKLPNPGERPVLAIPTFIHDIHYMPFEGYIKEKYGRGKVSLAYYGKANIIEAKPHKIRFDIIAQNKKTGKVETRRFLMVSHDKEGKGPFFLFAVKPKENKQ